MKLISELLTKPIVRLPKNICQLDFKMYVKAYLNNKNHIQVKTKPKTYHSCVSPCAKFEFEVDIIDMESKSAVVNTRYGLVAIDGFSKTVSVIPTQNKTPEAMIDGLKKIITPIGKPKQFYSDEESSMRITKTNRSSR